MKRKIVTMILAFAMLLTFVGCGEGNNLLSAEELEAQMPAGSMGLVIEAEEGGQDIAMGAGVEVDPHFFTNNVGRSGVTDTGESWTCTVDDWELIVSYMQQMRLERIRVMLLPSWYAPTTGTYTDASYAYRFDSEEMQSLYELLDVAQEQGMTVNLTLWGIDHYNTNFIPAEQVNNWISIPTEGEEYVLAKMFADCVAHLKNTLGYSCIEEITVYNEPNTVFETYFGTAGFYAYVDLVEEIDAAFRSAGLRDGVLFCLSDDAEDVSWMGRTLDALENIIDVAVSHTYAYGEETGNTYMQEDLARWANYYEEYGIPHFWGEFGTNDGGTYEMSDENNWDPVRGTTIARIALNMIGSGSVGMSYWVLYSQYYGSTGSDDIMSMGLIGFADENWACRPVWYAYSMFTRYFRAGYEIYRIDSGSDEVVALAVRDPVADSWNYFAVNTGDGMQSVSFLNTCASVSDMSVLLYDAANVPTNNMVITASDRVAGGQIVTYEIPANGFAVITEVI